MQSEWYSAGRYRNLDGVEVPGPQRYRRILKWQLGRRAAPELPGALNRPAQPIEVPAETLREPGPFQITWLGHASALIQQGGLNIITYPVFTRVGMGFVKRLAPAPMAPETLPALHAVLVSHNHYDHCDLPSLKSLRRLNPEALFVVPAGMDAWMRKRVGDPVVSVGWWRHHALGPIEIHAVPAQHWSLRGPQDECKTHWCGFVVRGEAGSAYFAGDTGFGRHFEAIADRYAVDVALLPIGAYAPRWFMRAQHMGPQEAIEAARILGAHLLPIHWGTYKLTDEPLDEPPRLAQIVSAEAGVAMSLISPGGAWRPTGARGTWTWAGEP